MMTRRWGLRAGGMRAATGLAMAAGLLTPSNAQAAVVATGTWAVGGGAHCQSNITCAAFIATCDPTLATKDGAQASIANIATSAGKDRYISWDGTSTAPQKMYVQFLSATCASTGILQADQAIPQQETRRVRVPLGTKWIAVGSGLIPSVANSFTMTTA